MKSSKKYLAVVAGAVVMLTAVVAYALSDVSINISSDGSSIVTSTGTFPVGSATVVGSCSDDGAGTFNFDFGDGSASTFNPVGIPGTGLTAVFVACNPLGTGTLSQVDGTATASLNLQVKLTGTLIADVGDSCMTGCINAPLTGQYDATLTGNLTGTASVAPDQVFANCNGQEGIINFSFGIPGDASVTLATNIDPASCQP